MHETAHEISGLSRKFTKDDVNILPLFYYDGDVVLVRDEETLAYAVARMRKERVLGFDTESRPCFRKGKPITPALVQIACSDIVFLFQLTWLPLHPQLLAVLESPSLIKAGVAIGDDMRLLRTVTPFTEAGVVDLGEVARARGLETRGLRTLAANFMGVRISKSAQCSNWEHRELSAQQVRYAATDAWISRKVYQRMDDLGFFDSLPASEQGSAAHAFCPS